MVQFVLVRKKKVVVFPKFSLVTRTASSFRRGFSLGMSPLHGKVSKRQRHSPFMLGEHLFQGWLDLAAIGALEIRKLHNHNARLGVASNTSRVKPDLHARRTQQNRNFGLLT